MANFESEGGSHSRLGDSAKLSVSVNVLELSPFIREQSVFPFADTKAVPPMEIIGARLATEAYNKCGFANVENKQECQSAFRLYEDALKAADGVSSTSTDRATLNVDSPEVDLVRNRVQNLSKAAQENQKRRDEEIVSNHVSIFSADDSKNVQRTLFLEDQRANLSGIRYAYALSLSAYGLAFQDPSALEKANKLINQAAVIDPKSQYHYEIQGAQARLNRGTWVDPTATRAEGLVLEASKTLNFPRFFSTVSPESRKAAVELIADAKKSNHEATREQLKLEEPFLSWDAKTWWSIERDANERVNSRAKNR
ncbi:MAG: hypothetical protein K2X81_05465 [Candidatus Obscuribacterales bacterium]|nr:hypothetical protein [Candidatus Obscuribacterales bacterium]